MILPKMCMFLLKISRYNRAKQKRTVIPVRIREYHAGDMLLRYLTDREGRTAFALLPEGGYPTGECPLQSCIQLRLAGETYPDGFLNGHSFRGSLSAGELRLKEQYRRETEDGFAVHTILNTERIEAEHTVSYRRGSAFVRVETAVRNRTDKTLTLEFLTSFSLGGIFPSEAYEDVGSVKLCRIRSRWSSEGRVEKIPLEDLQLEPSWSGYGANSERFGQTGSMPVRKFFPVAGVEDGARDVTWGAKLTEVTAWQMEAYRRNPELCLSGGLPDLDFGHWRKELAPGERFAAPPGILSVTRGDFDAVCRRLVTSEEIAGEDTLPVIFNEFCTTWGKPSEESVRRILKVLKGKPIDYFVIDAGWYADEAKGWEKNMGDWIVNKGLFPHGLKACAEEIRGAGMIPGIWFEPEVVGADAEAFGKTELLLKRDGQVITVGCRRFWDMRRSETIACLRQRVVAPLRDNGFGFVKFDYNDSFGMGCDGAESPGEGLRQQLHATREFFAEIKRELPGLRMELCASGGHRLESSLMSVSDFVSFSDAHEEPEIPVIAANLHRTAQPSKCEIWAVLRAGDDQRRLRYSLCNTFLGVMCLSGDVYDLSPEQWNTVEEAIRFYREAAPVILRGESYVSQSIGKSYRRLAGTQSVLRVSGNLALVLCHRFHGKEAAFSVALPGAGWAIRDRFGGDDGWRLENGTLLGELPEEFSAAAFLLEQKGGEPT